MNDNSNVLAKRNCALEYSSLNIKITQMENLFYDKQ